MGDDSTIDVIASTRLFAADRGGHRRPVSIDIGRPRSDEDSRACHVRIEGIGSTFCNDIYGDDAFQAFALAMSFVRRYLEDVE